MTRIPYISPALELLSIRSDTPLCVLVTSTEAYEDYGDYEWDETSS